jgi:hypothetical protein
MIMHRHNRIPRPSIYSRPSFHDDDYGSGEVIYITNPETGRVEPRRTVERRFYSNSPDNGDCP